MTKPLKIAIAGLGTVGVGVIKILETHKEMIAARTGRSIEIVAVSASNRTRDRGVDISGYDWADNVLDFASRQNRRMGNAGICRCLFTDFNLQDIKFVLYGIQVIEYGCDIL